MRGVLLLLTIFAAFAPPPASAAGTAQQREDCMADAFKFCASEIPFESRIEQCLRTNIRQLSGACRRQFMTSVSR